jgi:preprotein translocase subunit SecD
VPGDIALVQGQTPDGAPAPAFDVYYVLRYQPLLGDGELVDPRSSLDRSTGAGNAPVLTFRLTPAGAARVRSLSRTVALRGLDVSLPGDNHFQHFAVLLDGRIVAVPFIDFVQFPGGVDTSAGAQIEGGMSADRARALAAVLRGGPLPVTLAPLDS